MITGAWAVLSLFLIPIGGGIPAGVLMGRNLGIAWPVTVGIYIISDIILACLFEPLLLGLMAASKRWSRLRRISEAMTKTMQKITARYGHSTGPFTLILIAFGVDPMTGRAAAAAAGHKFVSGWSLAIMGDLIYFAILMVSTLWLDGILGDGTWTTMIILAGMMIIPWIVRRVRGPSAPIAPTPSDI